MIEPARRAAREEWRRYWPLVLAAGAGFSFTSVITAILGLFMEPWSREFGWSRALMSSGLTITSLSAFFLAPFVGVLVDRVGPRRLALPGIILLAVAIASLSLQDGRTWLWFASWTIFAIAGLATKPTIWTAGVTSTFETGRGLALGLVLSGSAVGQAIAPLIANWLIDAYGWRIAIMSLAAGWGGLAFLLCLFMLFDGYDAKRRERRADPAAVVGKPLLNDAPGLTIRQAIRSAALWRIGMSTFATMMVTVALVVHQVPIMLGTGVSRQTAVYFVSLAAVAGLFGKLVTGWLLDRHPARWVGGITLAMNMLTFALLLLPSLTTGIVFAAMFINGYTMGTKLQIASYLTSAYGGRRNFGAIFGVMASLISAGSGFGPLAAGLVFDRYGTYDPFLWLCIGASLLSAVLIFGLPGYPEWFGRPPAKKMAMA